MWTFVGTAPWTGMIRWYVGFKSCAYSKPKSGRIGDAARQAGRATRCQEHIRPLIGVIDWLNEVGAEDELRVISKQLTRLVFRAQPLPRAASSPKNRSARHRAALSPS